MASSFTITYVGGPTALLEVGGLRLLTDPTFDPPGRRYNFGWGTSSRKLDGPALTPEALSPVDAVLLSHDHHDDNLDDAGRAMLPSVGQVLTTPSGAKRLGGNAAGLAPWSSTTLAMPEGGELRVTATPARHGPPRDDEGTAYQQVWPRQAKPAGAGPFSPGEMYVLSRDGG